MPLDPRNIRGTNYLPSTTMAPDYILGLIQKKPLPYVDTVAGDGMFDGRHIAAELRAIALAGFNNIRIHSLSFWAWLANRRKYWSLVGTIAAECGRLGLTMTVGIWTSTGTSVLTTPRQGPMLYELLPAIGEYGPNEEELLRALWRRAIDMDDERRRVLSLHGVEPFVREPWFGTPYSEPDNDIFTVPGALQWVPSLSYWIDQYLEELADFFSRPDSIGARVLDAYDLFNEADVLFINPAAQAATMNFIKRTYDILVTGHQRNNAPPPPCTVGWAAADGRLANTVLSDVLASPPYNIQFAYYSTHCYLTSLTFAGSVRNAVSDAANAYRGPQPYVCSEFWDSNHASSSLEGVLDILLGFRAGGQIWGFLESNWPYGPPRFPQIIPDGIRVPQLSDPYRWRTAWPSMNEITFPVSDVSRTGADRGPEVEIIRRWTRTMAVGSPGPGLRVPFQTALR